LRDVFAIVAGALSRSDARACSARVRLRLLVVVAADRSMAVTVIA
jgi:hypothetical protein